MDKNLLKAIIHHVMANFGAVPSDFVDTKKSGSLFDPVYVLPKKFCFEVEDCHLEYKIWGCQLLSLQNEVRALLISLDGFYEGERDYVLVVQSVGAPAYGLYLCYDSTAGIAREHDLMLAVSIDGKSWMECTTFLQATFLAAMEQIKDLGNGWQRCSNYEELYASLLSFIKYHDEHFEETEQ
jgi:hypothetical protein